MKRLRELHVGAVETESIKRDAIRYRRLRSLSSWSMHELVWVDAYDGICNLKDEELDKKLDEQIADEEKWK